MSYDYDYITKDGNTYSTDQAMDVFEEWIDDNYEDVQVAGYSFSVGRALRTLDEIAFREEFSNWMDFEISEGNWFEPGDFPDDDEDED